MNLDFKNVQVNSTPMSGGDAFSYVPVELGFSSPSSRTTILWPNSTRTFKNQSDEWTAANDYQLKFDIGTIKVNQSWETTFRLQVKQLGLIQLFGPGSKLSFNNGTDSLKLPDSFVLSLSNITPVGLTNGTLYLDLLKPSGENYNTSVPMKWNLNYTTSNEFDTATVTETYWYSYRSQPFVQFGGKSNIPNGTFTPLTKPEYTTTNLDVKNFPAGDYHVKVIASVPGIPSVEDTAEFTKFYDNASVNILLK